MVWYSIILDRLLDPRSNSYVADATIRESRMFYGENDLQRVIVKTKTTVMHDKGLLKTAAHVFIL